MNHHAKPPPPGVEIKVSEGSGLIRVEITAPRQAADRWMGQRAASAARNFAQSSDRRARVVRVDSGAEVRDSSVAYWYTYRRREG